MSMRFILLIFILSFFSKVGFTNDTLNWNHLSYEQIADSINKYKYSDSEKALSVSKLYLKKARSENNEKNIGEGLGAIASCYYLKRDFKRAEEEAQKFVSYAEDINNSVMLIKSLILMADVQMIMPNIEEANRLLKRALNIAEGLENDLYKEALMSKIAAFYDLSGDTEHAISIRLKTVDMFEKKPIDSVYTEKIRFQTLTFAYSVLANAYLKVNNLDSSEYYNNLLKEMAWETDSCKLIYYYLHKGDMAIEQKEFNQAKDYYERSLEYCPPNYALFELNMAFRFGKVEHGLKNFELCKSILMKGLDNYEVTPNEEGYMDKYYKLLAEAFKETGDLENANFYFEKYINTQNELNKIQDDLSSSIKANEIANFKSELLQLEKEKESAKKRNYYIVLLGSLVILILLILLLKFYRIRKQNEIKFNEIVTALNEGKMPENSASEPIKHKENLDISEETRDLILNGLKSLEEKAYFLNQECNAYNVARKIKTNTSYLSKVVNAHFEKNFNAYINDLRINYAILKLKEDQKFRSYSIQSIAEDIGYKSADSFSKYFKLRTGLNPSFYIKQLNNL